MKIYAQTEAQHPKAKRNTPLPKRNDTNDHAKQAPIHTHMANAPPLHQEIKRTPEPDIKRPFPPAPATDESKEKRPQHTDIQELHRVDSSSLDLSMILCYFLFVYLEIYVL